MIPVEIINGGWTTKEALPLVEPAVSTFGLLFWVMLIVLGFGLWVNKRMKNESYKGYNI